MSHLGQIEVCFRYVTGMLRESSSASTSAAFLLLTTTSPRKTTLRGDKIPGTLLKPSQTLGGSWVAISRNIISRATILITHIRGLITPLITTHEPPSNDDDVDDDEKMTLNMMMMTTMMVMMKDAIMMVAAKQRSPYQRNLGYKC